MNGRKKFLIVGSGGRESAFATRLAEDTVLYAVTGHENKTIVDCVNSTGGRYMIGNTSSPELIADFAKRHQIDYAFVSADEPLANGVIDMLLENDIKAIGGTKEAARIEWDKVYSIKMMKRLCPEFTPFFMVVKNPEMISDAIREFESRNLQIVVKPQGLTGGKGVKVMPEHLKSYRDCHDYSMRLFEKNPDESILLVERLKGIEFTIMGITDGKNLVLAPASYDYPFRYEDDVGAGTGGMGCFTNSEERLPFMSRQDLSDCKSVMQRIIDEMRCNGLFFNGVLNGGFFKTRDGIRFMEFNGRFGDPEGLNVLSVLQGSFSELLIHIWNRTLSEDAVRFVRKASVTKYLVAKEYPDKSREPSVFCIEEDRVAEMGIRIYFASCIQTGKNQYQTLRRSRVVAFGMVSDKISDACNAINRAIDDFVSGPLEYRRDIGSLKSLERLKNAL